MSAAFRKFIQNQLGGMDINEGYKTKFKLSLIYSLTGWMMLGFVIAGMFKINLPDKPTKNDYLNLLGVKETNVVQYSGLKKIKEFQYKKDEDDNVDQKSNDVN